MKAAFLILSLALLPALAHADSAESTFKTYCSTCHGAQGKGDGPARTGMTPPPANFPDPARLANRSDDRILKTIREGGASVGLSPVMPPWKGVIKDEDIQNLAAYLRTLSNK